MYKNCTPDEIVNVTCMTLQLDVDKLKSKLRTGKYVDGRFIISYLLKRFCDIKYASVGSDILQRRACVVRQSKMKAAIFLKTNKQFKAKYEAVVKQLGCAR